MDKALVPQPVMVHVGPPPGAVTQATQQLAAACRTWAVGPAPLTLSDVLASHETACTYPEQGPQGDATLALGFGLGVISAVFAAVMLMAINSLMKFAWRLIRTGVHHGA